MVAHGKPTTIVSDNGTCIAAASILMDEEAQSLQLRPRARGGCQLEEAETSVGRRFLGSSSDKPVLACIYQQ
jgi:hypothetical protein